MKKKSEAYFITGASKGIGKSLTELMIYENKNVIVLVRNRDSLKNSSKLKVFQGDVTNPNIISKIFEYCIKNKIYVKGIVNNAGQRQRIPFLKIKKKDLIQIFNVNYFSIFFILQEYVKYLKKIKKKGNVVNIGSIVGQLGFSELSGYGSTKAALNGLTKCLASEFGKFVRFNTVNPGFTKTSFYKKFKKKSKLYSWTLSRIPNKRWAEPIEIANLINFLCSEKSSYINGESISIDGGWVNS